MHRWDCSKSDGWTSDGRGLAPPGEAPSISCCRLAGEHTIIRAITVAAAADQSIADRCVPEAEGTRTSSDVTLRKSRECKCRGNAGREYETNIIMHSCESILEGKLTFTSDSKQYIHERPSGDSKLLAHPERTSFPSKMCSMLLSLPLVTTADWD